MQHEIKGNKILILDEATSALDSITEKEIQEALKNLMENKTVIAVFIEDKIVK